jgi:hypothetical protein
MDHPFMESCATALAACGIGTFRYEFLYMEQKKSRTDSPPVAAARVREAVAEAAKAAPGVPLFAGGKSFGGRMTSTAQSEEPLAGVRGLVFLGFPLHAPGRPGTERAAHLAKVKVPMLFIQGSRDEFAQPGLLGGIIELLGAEVTLHPVEGGDHSFKVPKKIRGGDQPVMDEIADETASWMRSVLSGKPATRADSRA